MTRVLSLALVAALPAAAAVVRGTVFENFTGKLLARAVVVLEAMPGTPGGVRTVRTDRLGSYSFHNVSAGVYVLKASRGGYMPIEHGQKRWNSAGRPIVVEEADAPFFPLRLPRYSAITGTVVDENEVGIPGHEVSVYRATAPPEHVRDGAANDRGLFRVGGLEPGKYFVRTVGKQFEDGGYLPTFARATVRADQALLVETLLEGDAANIDVRPLPGKVFTLTVAAGANPETVITVASSLGRRSLKGPVASFSGLPPGELEIYVESPTFNSYDRISLTDNLHWRMIGLPAWVVAVTGGPAQSAKLRVRRKDLAGLGPEFTPALPNAELPPGRWELLLEPPDGYYAATTFPGVRGRLDGWVEVTSRANSSFAYRLASGAGSIRGVVKEGAYAPVYLEGWDPYLKKRAGELKAVRADARGNFRFANLAPGAYRLLSTFEYLMPSSEIIDGASAATVHVGPNSDSGADLELWVIR